MKNFFVSHDISTKFTHYVFGIVTNRLTKCGANRTTTSYNYHRNDRFEINI